MISVKVMRGGHTAVYLEKRRVGSVIRLGPEQYQYRPKGSAHLNGGAIFPSTLECVASLKGDVPPDSKARSDSAPVEAK